jgi:hypothetical protein
MILESQHQIKLDVFFLFRCKGQDLYEQGVEWTESKTLAALRKRFAGWIN